MFVCFYFVKCRKQSKIKDIFNDSYVDLSGAYLTFHSVSPGDKQHDPEVDGCQKNMEIKN